MPVVSPVHTSPNPPPPPPALSSAKVISLRVRPFGVSHLCFEVDGILGDMNTQLGALAPFFDFDAFYAILGAMPAQPATGSITFTANPAGGSIVLDGTTWTFTNTINPGQPQLLIFTTLGETLANAVQTLQESTDANSKKFLYSATSTVLILTAATGGPGGNSLTFSTTVSGATTSGTTLSGGDISRLQYDFPAIQAATLPFALCSLRAEPRKAALDKAINARQNAYFAKYGNAPAIIDRMKAYYSSSAVGSKPNRLGELSVIAQSQADQLKAAYTSDSRLNVVKTTSSSIASATESYGYSASGGETDESGITGQVNFDNNLQLTLKRPPAPPKMAPVPVPAWQPQKVLSQIPMPPPPTPSPPPPAGTNFDPSLSMASSATLDNETDQVNTTTETSSSNSAAYQTQSIVNTDYGYRVPYLESQAQNERAQISLIDQQFAAFMYEQNFSNLAQVFQNELNSIDADVYRLQIAYLNTILMSPFEGLVTGIYKNPGEAVRAGEPVIRVENYALILLEASLIFPNPIAIGSTVTVTTQLYDESSSPPTTIPGVVVAARGRSQDDQWQVIVQCNNLDSNNNPIFPLGYHFDYDDTTVTIS
jgi:hypothetical protein